ncbi:prepilin peptidase [Glycomyces sp. MUSA5-2]|uniref:prepilin peptidase n=1 Tax=Glycomyces sp. MUSA5-2 TaxID=2053002 RepID=UPI003009CBFF
MTAALALLAALAVLVLGPYAFAFESALAGGRFAPDLTARQRHVTAAMMMAIAGAAALAVTHTSALRPASIALIAAAAATPVLAFIDIRARQLPLPLTGLLAAAAALAFSIDAFSHGTWSHAWSALGSALVTGSVAAGFWYFVRGLFGLGDVTLLTVIALYLGWYSWAAAWLGVLAATFAACLLALAHKIRYRTKGARIPLGPAFLSAWWLLEALTLAT